MSRSLDGRVAVVTGAAAPSIGRAIAERLAADGARLVLGDADGDALAVTARELGAAAWEVGDLAHEEAARRLVGRAMSKCGRLDILVNNAGGGIIKPFLEHTPETLCITVDRNLWTAMWCCWHALRVMREQRFGRIINIGADSVRTGLWDHAAYNAAKAGMLGLTSGLAREFAADGVTINTVAPSAVNTPAMTAVIEKDPALAARFVSVIPIGRPAEMAEVASIVSYLASDEAGFITGQVIGVNGGSAML